jgi:hypothetical protein
LTNEKENKIRMLCRVLAKLALDNQLSFASFTQEDISTAFDAIYGQLPNDQYVHPSPPLSSFLFA